MLIGKHGKEYLEQRGVLYCNEILMAHRIHEESETSAVIGDNLRSKEDYEMFLKFWNRPVAKVLTKIYSLSEKENNV